MPRSQMKRPAAAGAAAAEAESNSKKPRAVSAGKQREHKYAQIAKMMKSAQDYPPQVVDMLAEAVPAFLGTPKAERHNFQHSMAKMVSDVLVSVEAEHKAKFDGLAIQLAEADTEKCAREGALEATAKEEKAAKEKFEEAQKALKEAESTRKKAEGAVDGFDAEMQKAKKNSEKADAELDVCKKACGFFKELEEMVAEPEPAAAAEAPDMEGSMEAKGTGAGGDEEGSAAA